MWLLESDGDVLNHKRLWLRPGRTYLFGRTNPSNQATSGFRINHKTVSRQHATLKIVPVKLGEGSNVRSKSEITLTDEKTKFSTELDGASMQGETKVLKNDQHTFRLGKSTDVFRISWHSVVFTFSLTSKEAKASKDPLAVWRARLEKLDIKTIVPYIIESTTHVVSGKRNTAKGLQALINGKHIVTEKYLDNFLEVSAPTDFDESEAPSRLEEDFDGNWLQELGFLPDKSKEPNERPPEDFEPNMGRASVFEGYTFVFCDQLQYETLQAPITNGGGKALHLRLELGVTTVEDIVRFVKTTAGEKGLGEFEDGSEGKGVVVVKFRSKGEHADWAARLDHDVAQALDHRLIEQSEFLDAILMNDASMLRRPLLPNEDDEPGPSNSTQRPNAAATAANEPSPRISKSPGRKVRAPIVSRFKGYDDDDDDFSMGVFSAPASARSQVNTGLSEGRAQHISNRLSFPDDDEMLDSLPASPNNNNNNTSSQIENPRKRPAPSSDIEDEESLVDKLLPAATALKRRREQIGISPEPSQQEMTRPAKKPKITPKEVNIKDAIHSLREAEESAAREAEENLREALDGMTVEQMKNLAVVEEMQLPARRPPLRQSNPQNDGDRWNPAWNGRKNFKRFRRRGDPNAPRRGASVIVPLEEVKRKDYGIGEDYWLQPETEGEKRRRKEKERRSQNPNTQSQNPASYASAQTHVVAEVPAELVVDNGTNSAGANGTETIDVDAPRTTRGTTTTTATQESRVASTGTASQVLMEKRGARNQAGTKKRKKFKAARDSDVEESEDELGEEGRGAKRVR